MEVPLGHQYNPRYKAQKIKGILNVFGVYDHTNNLSDMDTFLQKENWKTVLGFYKKSRPKI